MTGIDRFRALSAQKFAAYGLDEQAYVKPVRIDGETAFAVHAADGSYLSLFLDHETACSAIHQHDLRPASVH